MSLTIVSTPIGRASDVTLFAIEVVKESDLVIGEERKVLIEFLRQHDLTGRPIELLNEHSDSQDLQFLLKQCEEKNVALVSDCGTPGFCDPGADLVWLCRQKNIPVRVAPGASSLMAFLAGCGRRLDQFYFRGFLSGKKEQREDDLQQISQFLGPVILMDTPYRLERLVEELGDILGHRPICLGINLTSEQERFFYGSARSILSSIKGMKAEFVLLVEAEVENVRMPKKTSLANDRHIKKGIGKNASRRPLKKLDTRKSSVQSKKRAK